MVETAYFPIFRSGRPAGVSQPKAGPRPMLESLEARPLSRRSEPPPAAPTGAWPSRNPPTAPLTAEAGGPSFRSPCVRSALVEGLRRRVREIERHPSLVPQNADMPSAPWRLGAPAIDAFLDPAGLHTTAVHEVKPHIERSEAGAVAAALGFALCLAARHLQALAGSGGEPRILWCSSRAAAREAGLLYGPGLAGLGLDPRALLLVETAREKEALWAIEEGLKSGSIALVAGMLKDVAITPARRLSLAAEQHGTPCLLVTGSRTPASAATATRWRVAPAPGASHPFDPRAPGACRFRITLERCRRSSTVPGAPVLVEWSDETNSFRMAADVADRAHAPSYTLRRAG